jgi:hypothetical protein
MEPEADVVYHHLCSEVAALLTRHNGAEWTAQEEIVTDLVEAWFEESGARTALYEHDLETVTYLLTQLFFGDRLCDASRSRRLVVLSWFKQVIDRITEETGI